MCTETRMVLFKSESNFYKQLKFNGHLTNKRLKKVKQKVSSKI